MSGTSSLFLRPGLAFLDQSILSGANFVLAIVLMKTVSPEEYGYYAIAFAASLFVVSLQNAVVTTPLAVSLAGKHGDEKDAYAGALYWGQIVAVVPAAAVALAIPGIGAVSFAVVGILLREFLRAYYFAEQSPFKVLLMDSCFAATYLASIALACRWFGISASVAFVLMGASALLISALFRPRSWKFSWPVICESYKRHWPLAKWSLTGVAVTHVQSYSTLYLIGTLLGGSAAGSVAASKLPITPMALLQTGWNKVSIPRGAHLREAGQLRQFLKEQKLAATIVAVAVAAYAGLLFIMADFLKAVLFNGSYEGALDFIGFWAAINIAVFAGVTASAGLQVMREFGAIAKINFVTMVVTLGLTANGIRFYGIEGGLAASLAGESLLAAGLWRRLSRLTREAHPVRTAERSYAATRLDREITPSTAAGRGCILSPLRGSQPDSITCSICVATYRRPAMLDRLLTSLEEQLLPNHVALEVIVVDNDSERTAAAIVARHGFHYFVEPVKNISLARNLGVAKAKGEYLLFIDDDEVAAPDWVASLLEAAQRHGADGVFGPVFPIFDDAAPEWIRKGRRLLVDTIPKSATGTEALATWAGNCLIKADRLKSLAQAFDVEYGNTGGEDTELFNRMRRNGARLIYCNEATVFEHWPPARARLSYLLKRGLKGGNTHTRRTIAVARSKGTVRFAMLLKAVTFGLVSLALSVITFPDRVRRTYWQMKCAANIGRFMAAVGHHYRSYN